VGDNKKVANGVVALGSAAVMAIYGAGYAKTRAAADRFAQQAAERRPHIPAASGDDETTALALDAPAPPPLDIAPVEPRLSGAPTAAPEAKLTASSTVEISPVAAAPAKVNKTEAPADTTAPASTAAPAAGEDDEPAASPVQTAAAQSPAPAPAPAAQAPAAPQAAAPQAPAPAPVPAPVPAPAAPAKATYKDGTFYGWGTSRHGDIQAAVVIENGRITVARVERCLTRYSCNWIIPIPPRILLKQGTTYDYVSGATESSDAFQDAVSEALSTAK
jgi:uncharacterized protein with FMN-binding domain